MFQVIEYETRWVKRPKAPELVPQAVGRKVVGKFDTLEEAREFSECRPRSVIQFPPQYIEGLNT